MSEIAALRPRPHENFRRTRSGRQCEFRDVARGEVVGLLGDNGRGQVALIKMCLRRPTAPEEGEIVFDGQPVQFASPMGRAPAPGSRRSTRTSRSPNNLDVGAKHFPRPRGQDRAT